MPIDSPQRPFAALPAPQVADARPLARHCLALVGGGPVPAAAAADLQDAVAAALARCLRPEDTVSPLDGGALACLLNAPPDRTTLTLLCWQLLDAAWSAGRLAAQGQRQAWAAQPGWQPGIGLALAPADGLTYRALLRNATAALARARQQKSGYAFFDERRDIWDPAASQAAVPGRRADTARAQPGCGRRA